jgi:hypothetical protein
VWAHSFTFSRIPKNVNVTLGLHFWPTPFHALALVANPRLGLWQCFTQLSHNPNLRKLEWTMNKWGNVINLLVSLVDNEWGVLPKCSFPYAYFSHFSLLVKWLWLCPKTLRLVDNHFHPKNLNVPFVVALPRYYPQWGPHGLFVLWPWIEGT